MPDAPISRVEPRDDFDTLGYIRVSTPQQAEPQRTSLTDQERAVRQMAAELGRSMGEVYRDEGISGATAVARPAFMTMLADAVASPRPNDQPGLILALNASRWGRFASPVENAAILFRLRRAGWLVRFVEGDSGMLALPPIAPLSDEVSEAITAHLADPHWRLMPELEFFYTIVSGALAAAPSDRHARALLRLSEDMEFRGDRNALMRVLSGDVDLVALLDSTEG